jgi:hypothetical protein
MIAYLYFHYKIHMYFIYFTLNIHAIFFWIYSYHLYVNVFMRGRGHSPVVRVAVAHPNDQSSNPVRNEFLEFSCRGPASTISFSV